MAAEAVVVFGIGGENVGEPYGADAAGDAECGIGAATDGVTGVQVDGDTVR